MLTKTQGILLHAFPYTDSSMIARVYTDRFGMQSYLVQGIKGNKKGLRNTLMRTLSIADIDVYHRHTRTMQRLKEICVPRPFRSIHSHPHKRQLAFFIAETLIRSVREEEPNVTLYGFLIQVIRWMEESETPPPEFHLLFLVLLTRHLGFLPELLSVQYCPAIPRKRNTMSQPASVHSQNGQALMIPESGSYFDMRNGRFEPEPLHGDFIFPPLTGYFLQLINSRLEDCGNLQMPVFIRKELLEKMVHYYRIHLPGMAKIKSLEILEELLCVSEN